MTERPEHIILQPPHEHLLNNYPSIYHIPAFINNYFKVSPRNPVYPKEVMSQLRSTYHQSIDGVVPMVHLLERFYLVAAEYGFPDVSEHGLNHNRDHFKKKLTDPLHIIANMIHLATRNLTVYPIKLNYIEEHNLQKYEAAKVWARFVTSSKQEKYLLQGDPDVNRDFGFKTRTLIDSPYPLPIFVPDHELHKKIAQFDFSLEDAEKMTTRDFRASYFPEIKDAFSQFCNLEEIVV